MALLKVSDDELILQLLTVFRSVGYDGASMALLSEATGLQKASLYHRFPEGKQAMAKAVLDHIQQASQTGIVDVLQSTDAPADRLNTVFTAIDGLYNGGELSCVLRALSLGTAAAVFRQQIAQIFSDWISGFTQLALDMGYTEVRARQLAQNVVIRVQGVLILAQTLNQPDLFGQILAELKTDFILQQ